VGLAVVVVAGIVAKDWIRGDYDAYKLRHGSEKQKVLSVALMKSLPQELT
jgi:hypothetical protein